MSNERCVRCGSNGEDRRTLWMSCFYAMEELGIPFDKEILFTANVEELTSAKEPVGIKLPDGKQLNIQAGTVCCSGELLPHQLYTLRVCKRCRGEWLAMIKSWFRAVPQGQDHDADDYQAGSGSGIFIRENGVNKEITREEWDRRNPGCVPVTFKPPVEGEKL